MVSPSDLDDRQQVARMAANLLRLVAEDKALWDLLRSAASWPASADRFGRVASLMLAARLESMADEIPRPALDPLETMALEGASATLRRLATEEELADRITEDHPALTEHPRFITSLDMEPAVLRQLADQLDGMHRRLQA